MAAVTGSDVVSDVPAAAGEFAGQLVTDDDRAEVCGAIDVLQRGHRNAPVMLLSKDPPYCRRNPPPPLPPGLRQPALIAKVACGLDERVTDQGGRPGQVRV
jgi:hypothetical protein